MSSRPEAEIRLYTPEDYAQVRQNLEEGDLFYPAMDSEDRLNAKVAQNPGSILVAVINGIAVGNVFITDDWGPFFFRLAVRKDHRGQGVGKKLVEAVEARVKDKGYKELYMLVAEEDTELKDMYHRWGFGDGNLYRFMFKELG